MNRNWQAWLAASALLAAPAWAGETITESAWKAKRATFSMYCYWTGEATLGRVDGVLASRIGDWRGDEIVQVDYDPAQTDIGELARANP